MFVIPILVGKKYFTIGTPMQYLGAILFRI